MTDAPHVVASKGVTVNIGDYESQRIDATLYGYPYPGEEEACLEALHARLDAYLIDRIVALGKALGKTRWSRSAVAKRFGLVDRVDETRVDAEAAME